VKVIAANVGMVIFVVDMEIVILTVALMDSPVIAIAQITVILIAHVLNLKGNTNEKVPIIFSFLFFKWLLSKL